jgi:phosphocarrier protein HPr
MPAIFMEINNRVGLHARPAAVFVKTASQFKSTISIEVGSDSANAKSILSVLSLGVESGVVIKVVAEGEDAEQALKALQDMNQDKFGEKA